MRHTSRVIARPATLPSRPRDRSGPGTRSRRSIRRERDHGRRRATQLVRRPASFPRIWIAVYMGGLLTIGFTLFFGSQNLPAQVTMTGVLSIPATTDRWRHCSTIRVRPNSDSAGAVGHRSPTSNSHKVSPFRDFMWRILTRGRPIVLSGRTGRRTTKFAASRVGMPSWRSSRRRSPRSAAMKAAMFHVRGGRPIGMIGLGFSPATPAKSANRGLLDASSVGVSRWKRIFELASWRPQRSDNRRCRIAPVMP